MGAEGEMWNGGNRERDRERKRERSDRKQRDMHEAQKSSRTRGEERRSG